jgi:hypothetical protein
MSDEVSKFVDEYFNVHERGTELGRGGQGVVFRTRDPDVAVKLALDGNGQPVTHADYVEKLRRMRALPVPRGLHLSTPMAVLQETAGYAMRLLSDMVPFADFWPQPSLGTDDSPAIPGWLTGMPRELARSLIAYRDTGGLHRRLVALYKCSTILSRLHGAGLVYGDVSPANAFISRKHSSREVWLIDADNLRYEAPGSKAGVYTPRFGAPELVQGIDGARPRTDCHAFAVMAFWMLTTSHPFVGAHVEDGGSGDWADEGSAGDVDERAYAGLVPWILDEDDDCNRKDNSLVDHVLTTELSRLFQATFGPGRTRPWVRPSMVRWSMALARAADAAITCPGCKMGYYLDFDGPAQGCPFCGDACPRVLIVTAYDWLGRPIERDRPVWRLVRGWIAGSPDSILPDRVLHPFSMIHGDRDVLRLSEEDGELRLVCCDARDSDRFAVASGEAGDEAFCEFEGTAALPISQAERGFWLRVAGRYPRVLRCVLRRSDR